MPRSIPACAGKPRTSGTRASRQRVHPRVCGEAPVLVDEGFTWTGPSPRVRGSRQRVELAALVVGSIPACAGKPGTACPSGLANGVHPRVCGEAILEHIRGVRIHGPSPRVRGSLCQIIDGISVSIQLSMNGSGASA